jgi:murein L,D-transpeptidase YafK
MADISITEFKALTAEDRDTKADEMISFWKQVKRKNQRRETSRTPEEKSAILTEFNTLLDNTDLVNRT